MRVIAGQYRSRRLHSLPGLDIRPTSDRLRETLFNVLCAGNPDALANSTWVDLYAGTGAVGIEALSRGAGMVYFVEASKAAADVIAANLKSLGITHGFQILKVDAGKALRQLDASASIADFVFLDPPYSMANEYAKCLADLVAIEIAARRWLGDRRTSEEIRSRRSLRRIAALAEIGAGRCGAEFLSALGKRLSPFAIAANAGAAILTSL